jgi:hypothetical protein
MAGAQAARFVLLHSPLLGPSSLRATADELRALGETAETPAWPRLGELEAGFYEPMAERVAAQIAAGPVVLVAHSGAGALVPAVAARLREPVAAIFMDAILPHPGRSWFDTAPQNLRESLRSGVQAGLLPAWHDWWPPGALERLVPDEAVRQAMIEELEPIPAAYFEAAAPPGEAPARSAYLELSDAYEDEGRLANRLGWPLVRLPLQHLAPLSHPAAVARALIGLAERLVL